MSCRVQDHKQPGKESTRAASIPKGLVDASRQAREVADHTRKASKGKGRLCCGCIAHLRTSPMPFSCSHAAACSRPYALEHGCGRRWLNISMLHKMRKLIMCNPCKCTQECSGELAIMETSLQEMLPMT